MNYPKPNNQQKCRAGEACVVAELNKRGAYATSFAGNMPNIDILAMDQNQTRSVYIQVKTKINPQGWQVGLGAEKEIGNNNFFVILVDLKKIDRPDFYIFDRSTYVNKVKKIYKDYINRPKRNGQPKKETNIRWIDYKNFTDEDKKRLNNWKILGFW